MALECMNRLRREIKHVICLTMENHSFDNIAGYWDYHPDIDNLRNRPFCNEYTNPNWTVWGEPLNICAAPFETEVPLVDPDHNFAGVTYQIYRKWNATNADVPNMGGFIERQSEKYQATPGEAGSRNILARQTLTVSLRRRVHHWVQDNAMDHLVHANDFYRDLEEGTLPTFSYINPECCSVDSMHPSSNMAAGEQMIKHLYDAVRRSKYWDNVLIILNFDEHGGFADHVPPPVNVPAPDDRITFDGESEGHPVKYDFTRLGVRVPAFLISPWIQPNTLIHDDGTMYAPDSAYTHSSILHFLQELWGLEGLNNRVQWAKTFEHVFGDLRRVDTPVTLETPTWYGSSWEPKPVAYALLNQDESYYKSRQG
ncbi:hypothetical protein FE257_007638 [Aspergillus nanangensis]|uniref:Uncharacterized protein n=1 Tax=Aspergillus nanangensis TaxID=2582783 RepID=A0AAD4CMA2_ASPNN|nr:hypothetical protein FE257_007638 [Aspergillus nanangensis]